MAQTLEAVMAEVIADYGAAIRTLERRIDTARRIIASPDQLRLLAEGRMRDRDGMYGWEYEDDRHTSFPRRLWGGLTTDTATGEGTTQSCFVTWAGSNAEFRRQLSVRVGRHLADAARVSDGRGLALECRHLVSPSTIALIGAIADGEEASPGFAYFAQLHRNTS
jgi:hypothetical protein